MTIMFELLDGLAALIGAWIPLVTLPLSAILLVAAVTGTFRTASVRSSFAKSRLRDRNSVLPVTRRISDTWLRSPR